MFSSFEILIVFGPCVQVREVTAQLSRPVTASWESLGPSTTSIPSSIILPEKQEAEVKEPEGDNQDTKEGKDETGREERSAAQTGIYCISIEWMFIFWAYMILKGWSRFGEIGL